MPTEVEVLEEIRDAIREIADRDVSISFANGKHVYQVTGRSVTSGSSSGGMGSPFEWIPEEVDEESTPTGNILRVSTRAAPISIVLPTALLSNLTGPLSIKDESGQGEAFPITVTGEGAELFDGESSMVIDQDFACIGVYPATGGWHVLWYYGG
jgi:hypothetical protein